tara:strand:+ start:699 stop:899 length:201 start_codon:yes stop_codon:yes gene_type:complete
MKENNIILLFQQMEGEFVNAIEDVEKFVDGGNKSAGTRIRKRMQNVKNLAQKVRVEVQEQKNSVPA